MLRFAPPRRPPTMPNKAIRTLSAACLLKSQRRENRHFTCRSAPTPSSLSSSCASRSLSSMALAGRQDLVKALNYKRGMCSLGGMKVGFDSEMEIHGACDEPNAFTFGHRRGLLHFRKAQDATIKRASAVLAAEGNGDLHVLDAEDFHYRSRCWAPRADRAWRRSIR